MSAIDEQRPDKDADPTGGESGEQGAYPGGDSDSGPEVDTGAGGYAGRDPATDMPRVPSAPETQDDPKPHGGEPDPDAPPPPASN